MPKSVLQSNWYYGIDFDLNNERVKAYIELEKAGFKQIPTGSNHLYFENFEKTVEFCKRNTLDENLIGFLQTVWRPTVKEWLANHIKAMEAVKIAREKYYSLIMFKSKVIKVRPHLLLCAVCQYGEGIRPPFEPDNLPGMIQVLIKNSSIKIQLIPKADWLICAPCPYFVKKCNGCVCNMGRCSLYCDLKDLNVLQRLGLTYGTIMNARKLYQMIFEKIPTVAGVCALENFPFAWLWHNGCGKVLFERIRMYEKGREMLIKEFKLK
jgi:hypothetical protein